METVVSEPAAGTTTVELGGVKVPLEAFVAAAESAATPGAVLHADEAKDRLRSFVERVERLEEEKKAVSDDIKEVYTEAKGEGFDVKIMREVIRLRKFDPAAFQDHEVMLDIYLRRMGMR